MVALIQVSVKIVPKTPVSTKKKRDEDYMEH